MKIGGATRKSLILLQNEDLKVGSPYDISTRVVLVPTVQSTVVAVRSGHCYHIKVGDLYLKTMVNPDFE